jgi:hypothetical protein
MHNATIFAALFNVRIVSWAEGSDDGHVFTVIDANGRVVTADSVELLALECAPVAAYGDERRLLAA